MVTVTIALGQTCSTRDFLQYFMNRCTFGLAHTLPKSSSHDYVYRIAWSVVPRVRRLLPLDGNHDVPVFEEVPAGRFVNETPPEPTYRLDAVTEHFWGRAVDVQKVRRTVWQYLSHLVLFYPISRRICICHRVLSRRMLR